MSRFTIRSLAVLTAVLASFLAITTSALGATRPDDRAGVRGPDNAATQVVAGDPGSSARPDNRAGALGAGTDAVEAAASAGSSNGFDWADAGIGAAATTAAAMLLGFVAFLAMPKRQHRRAAA